MIFRKTLLTHMFLITLFCSLQAAPFAEQLKHASYAELCDTNHGSKTFDSLYAYFDELVELLQTNQICMQKYAAKERFISTKYQLIFVVSRMIKYRNDSY